MRTVCRHDRTAVRHADAVGGKATCLTFRPGTSKTRLRADLSARPTAIVFYSCSRYMWIYWNWKVGANALAQSALRRFTQLSRIEHPTFQLRGSKTELSYRHLEPEIKKGTWPSATCFKVSGNWPTASCFIFLVLFQKVYSHQPSPNIVHFFTDILVCLVTFSVRSLSSEKLSSIRIARRIAPAQPPQAVPSQAPVARPMAPAPPVYQGECTFANVQISVA